MPIVFSFTKFEDCQGCWLCASISFTFTYMYGNDPLHNIGLFHNYSHSARNTTACPIGMKEKLVHSVYMYSRNDSHKLIVMAIPGCGC